MVFYMQNMPIKNRMACDMYASFLCSLYYVTIKSYVDMQVVHSCECGAGICNRMHHRQHCRAHHQATTRVCQVYNSHDWHR